MILTQFRARDGPPDADGRPHAAGAAPHLGGDQESELCLPGKTRVRKMAMLGGRRWRWRSRAAEFDASIKDFLTAPTAR